MTLAELIGANIKSLRENAGLQQAEVANKLGYKTYQSLCDIENGNIHIPLSKVEKLANILGCTVNDVLADTRSFQFSTKAANVAKEMSTLSEDVQTILSLEFNSLINVHKMAKENLGYTPQFITNSPKVKV